jgi:hypothetical protein
LINLHNWNYLFVIGGVLAAASLRLLKYVEEEGEVEKQIVVGEMKVAFRNKLKERMRREAVLGLLYFPLVYPITLTKKVHQRIEKRVTVIRRLNHINTIRKRA